MKKAFLLILIIAISVTGSFAQKFTRGGVHRGGTSPVNKQKMADRLKAELKLTDDQANAVVVILQDYQLKSRSIKISTLTTEKEKEEKLQPLEEERIQKLKKIIKDEQIGKVDDIMKEVESTRGQQ